MSSEDPKCDICGRENRLIKEDGKHFNFCPKVFHWHEGYKEHEKADFPIEKEKEVTKKEREASEKAKQIMHKCLDRAYSWRENYDDEDIEGWSCDLIDRYIQEYFAGFRSRLNIDEFGHPLPPKKGRNVRPVTFIKVDPEKEEGR